MVKQLLSAALFLLAGIPPLQAAAAAGPETFAALAERLKPSVVNIATTKVVQGREFFHGIPFGGGGGPGGGGDLFDEFFDRFFGGGGEGNGGGGGREFRTQSLGSGFILDRDGYILTNNHVVEKADEILVRLSDEHEYVAEVVGTDPKTDLALIRIRPEGIKLVPAELGSSEAIRVGDWVIAIGNPFGYGHTVTQGIISAKARVIGAGPYDNFLQTDAAINPGNSGGPLFSMEGKVVGIATAIIQGGQGIGFAIPINLAKDIATQLKTTGKVTRGWLGVMIQKITPELAKSFGLEEGRGALVSDVVEGGPAAKAGIQRGDVIVEFAGTPIRDMGDLPRLVAEKAPGAEVKVTLLRKGDRKTLNVTLGELEAEAPAGRAQVQEQLGITVQEITPELQRALDLDTDKGLVVSGVESGSSAATAGLRRGDVVVEVNQQEVSTLDEYRKALAEARGQESVLFLVKRGRGTQYVVVPLSK